MDQWIAAKNIEHFTHSLTEEKDAEKRRILKMLLAQELQKQLHYAGND